MSSNSLAGDDASRITRKRNRKPLSCNHCRIRKLKCSRSQPCEACTRSGDKDTCSFAVISSTSKGPPAARFKNKDELRNRVDHLESLLLSVVGQNNSQSSKSSTDQSPDQNLHDSQTSDTSASLHDDLEGLTEEMGVMKVDQGENRSIYLGSNHWVSILQEVQDIKDYLACNMYSIEEEALKNQMTTMATEYSTSIFGCFVPRTTNETLIECLPPVPIMNRLIDRFYTHVASSYPILHEQSFRQQYESFKENASTAQTSWLACLYAVMYVAEQSYQHYPEGTGSLQPDSNAREELYKSLAIQALVAANFTFPQMTSLQALVLYVVGEYEGSTEPGMIPSLILSVAIRLAMRMGIHRALMIDISPFQAQMRRRLWTVIHQMDIQFSFTTSLPRIIRQSDCTASLPLNLEDKDFNEETKELPKARFPSETTVVSYSISRMRLMQVLGKVMVYLESGAELTPEVVQSFDEQLLEARKTIPHQLRVSAEVGSTTVPPLLRKKQITLDRIYLIAQCMLRRKHLATNRQDPSMHADRRIFVESALQLLRHQSALYMESDPRQSQKIQLRHRYSLTAQDFFLAGLAIAMDLHYGFQNEPLTPSSSDQILWGYDRRLEMIAALEKSNRFYERAKDDTVETVKAFSIFNFVIERARVAQSIVEANAATTATTMPSTVGTNDVSYATALPITTQAGQFPSAFQETLPTFGSFGGDLDFNWDLSAPYVGVDENFESLRNWMPVDLQLHNGGQ